MLKDKPEQKKCSMNKCLNFSIVGLVDNHNPSILNPDFLERHGIVPKEWGWELGNTITTPSVAVVEYKSGVTIYAEPNKLQITDLSSVNPNESKIQKITEKYLQIMPTVRYTSVGINFLSVIDMEDVEKGVSYLKGRFLKKDAWESEKYPLEGTGFQFSYIIDGTKLLFDVKAGKVTTIINSIATTAVGIVLNANFNKDLAPQSADEVVTCLHGIPTNWDHYNQIIDNIKP